MDRELVLKVESSCISSGYCRNSAPDVFGAREDKRSYVLHNPVPHSEAVQQAMESCPVEAIRAQDAKTGVTVFPED